MSRYVDPRAQAIRERRRGIIETPMLWIEAKNRSAPYATEALGLWGGADDDTVTVTDLFTGLAQPRRFYGAGTVLGVDTLAHAAGLGIRAYDITLSSISVAVQDAIRAYNPRGARVQVWRRVLDPDNRRHVAAEPVFKGYVNGAPIVRPQPGGEATVTLQCVSTARTLTITSSLVKSDAAQRARVPGDRFRQHKATIHLVEVPWGAGGSKGGKGKEK